MAKANTANPDPISIHLYGLPIVRSGDIVEEVLSSMVCIANTGFIAVDKLGSIIKILDIVSLVVGGAPSFPPNQILN